VKLQQLIALICFTLVLAGGSRAAEPEPIVIGTTQSLTDHFQEFGTEQLRGLQMWVADVNSRGQLLGRPVELKYYDDGSRDDGTLEGFTRLIEQDGVDFLIGPYSSSLTLAASKVAEEHNMPMVATAASSEEIWSRGLKNIFGVDTPAGSYVKDVCAVCQTDASTAALLYADTEFGRETAAGARRNAEFNGLEFLVDESYPPEQRDFSDLALRLKNANPDVIMGVTSLEDSIAMVRAIRAANVRPKMLAFTVGPALREFGEQLGGDAEGVVGVVQWLPGVPVPGAQDFSYRYRQRYGNNPGVHAVIGYSAGQILEAAIRLAGSTDPKAVREQLRTMFFRSLLGKYQVDETGRQIGKRNYVMQWQDNRRRLVSPEEVAESTLIYPLP
jgi:branched-chain amino acid transport system substrate-binding protein